jgi:hypothetical protein
MFAPSERGRSMKNGEMVTDGSIGRGHDLGVRQAPERRAHVDIVSDRGGERRTLSLLRR